MPERHYWSPGALRKPIVLESIRSGLEIFLLPAQRGAGLAKRMPHGTRVEERGTGSPKPDIAHAGRSKARGPRVKQRRHRGPRVLSESAQGGIASLAPPPPPPPPMYCGARRPTCLERLVEVDSATGYGAADRTAKEQDRRLDPRSRSISLGVTVQQVYARPE